MTIAKDDRNGQMAEILNNNDNTQIKWADIKKKYIYKGMKMLLSAKGKKNEHEIHTEEYRM